MTFRGIGGSSRSRDDDSPYRDYSRASTRDRRRVSTSDVDFDNYIFSSKAGVDHAIDVLEDLLDEYGVITVADVSTQVGRTPRGVDNRWGWKSVRDFDSIRTSDGWILSVPRPRYLD